MIAQDAFQVIQKTLAQLRPAIQGDGGDIELVKYEDNIVYVKLHGACVDCPVSFYTLKMGVEEALRAKLPELKEVIAVE
jgi:Fe-S cluster biogenesis protein NfuA